MASIIIVGGKTAINLDHVVNARWDEEERKLTLFLDIVDEVRNMPFGSQSSETYTLKHWELAGDVAEEAWEKIADN
jgi:hypothetical protein